MTQNINHIKNLSQHFEATEGNIVEKDLLVLLISWLPEECNYLITALETIAEDHMT